MFDENVCSHKMYDRWSMHGRHCSIKPSVVRNGKHYCKIHDPEYVALKDKLRREKWEKEWAESAQRNKFNAEAIANYESVKEQRDELRAALEALCAWHDHSALTGLPYGAPVASWAPSFDETVKMVRAALAKCKDK